MCRCWLVAASVIAVLVAVLISNMPEGLSSSAGLMKAKRTRGWILGVWIGVAIVSGVVAALAYAALGNAVLM